MKLSQKSVNRRFRDPLVLSLSKGLTRSSLIFGTGSWVNLYRIYEMIEDDMKGKIVQNEWATRSLLERLSRTANHPDSIGDEARHGRQKQDPPKNPMPLSEAKALIETIMHNWLQWKSEQQTDTTSGKL